MTTREDALLERVGALLRERGERMTAPRRAVLLALAAAPGHVSAEDVQHRARERRLPMSTVYRALETLSALGVVQHIHLGHGATAYHLTDDGDAHVHAQCRRCGVVLDLPGEAVDAVARLLRDAHGFTLDPAHTALSGTCWACAGAC